MKTLAEKHQSASLGQEGERLGCLYLTNKGYQILATNYSNPLGRRLGEIDIIAKKNGVFIFVEVKTRLEKTGDDTLPEENITRDKLRRLEKIAHHYLRVAQLLDHSYQFDALAILYNAQKRLARIRHLEHVFL